MIPQSLVRQAALQAAALLLILSLAWPYYLIRQEALPLREAALLTGVLAFIFATLTHQAWWWRLIHTVFIPLAWFLSRFAIDPVWFLLAFIVLFFIYRGALSGQIPLYLSNSDTAQAVAALITEKCPLQSRCLDLGAGIGSLILPLARHLPQAQLVGVENAPATWLIGYCRTRTQRNVAWRWGDLWALNLAEYDVVYAFLSPAPMPELWRKVQAEMRPGTLFISNSFAVPDVEVQEVIELADARQTCLYCYTKS